MLNCKHIYDRTSWQSIDIDRWQLDPRQAGTKDKGWGANLIEPSLNRCGAGEQDPTDIFSPSNEIVEKTVGV